MTSVRDLLAAAFPAPSRDVDLQAIERALRHRRRLRMTGRAVLVAGVVAALAGGIALAGRPSGSPQVTTLPSGSLNVQHNGIAILLPRGWRVLGIDGGAAPALLVGTTPVPTAGIHGCGLAVTPGTGAYLQLGVTPTPTGITTPSGAPAPTSPPRPPQFSVDNALGTDCQPAGFPIPVNGTPPPSSAGTPNHTRDYMFTIASGNTVQAEVTSVGDPTQALLREAIAVLNTAHFAYTQPIRLTNGAPTSGRADATVRLPTGWRQLPSLASGVEPITGNNAANPPEVLVVGTTRRPASTIEPCTSSPRPAAYLVITAVPLTSFGSTTPIPSRPARFTASGGADCGAPGSTYSPYTTPTTNAGTPSQASTTTPGAPSGTRYHARGFMFTDNGQAVSVELVSVGDASKALLAEGIRILNTLKISPTGG